MTPNGKSPQNHSDHRSPRYDRKAVHGGDEAGAGDPFVFDHLLINPKIGRNSSDVGAPPACNLLNRSISQIVQFFL